MISFLLDTTCNYNNIIIIIKSKFWYLICYCCCYCAITLYTFNNFCEIINYSFLVKILLSIFVSGGFEQNECIPHRDACSISASVAYAENPINNISLLIGIYSSDSTHCWYLISASNPDITGCHDESSRRRRRRRRRNRLES